MYKRAIPLLVLLSCLAPLTLMAQRTFIRVYTAEGHRITKGDVVATTDSTLIIQQHKKQVELPVAMIGFIKPRRTFGHGIALGSSIGALVCGIVGLASGNRKGSCSML